MSEVLAQLDRDAAVWSEWCSGLTQAEIADRRGIAQQTVSDAVNRYSASIPAEDKQAYRERALARLEELYAAHRDRARTNTRSATLCRQVVMDEARLLGLITNRVEHSGEIEHAHHYEPAPPVDVLLERWRQEGKLTLRGELTRTDP